MSGGDGNSPGNQGLGHSGGKPSGGINGGSSGGSGGSSGGNNGPGWGTSHTPNGDIHHYDPGQFGNGGNNGGHNGGSGGGGNSGGNGGGGGKPGRPVMGYGAPILLGAGAGLSVAEGITVSMLETAVDAIITSAIRALVVNPETIGAVALFALSTTELAKDDPNMMSKVVMSFPGEVMLKDAVKNLTADITAITVNTRVVDVVKDEKQQIAVVRDEPTTVGVVTAKPTSKPGVYSVNIPGLGTVNLAPTTKPAPAGTLPRGVTAVPNAKPADTTQSYGMATRDIVVRFAPDKNSGGGSVYLSVIDKLTPEQLRKRKEEEAVAQAIWRIEHPDVVAGQELEKARRERAAAVKAESDATARQRRAADAWNQQAGVDIGKKRAEFNGLKAQMDKWNQVKTGALNSGEAFTPGSRAFGALNRAVHEMRLLDAPYKAALNAVQAYDKALKERDDSQRALNQAVEARKKADEKEKKAKEKKDKEDRRQKEGTATGKGEKVGDKWLWGANEGEGSPIPDRIADKLRGKKFKNFDDFRKRFWETVSKDKDLSKQFDKGNNQKMQGGGSPNVGGPGAVGKLKSYQIHHRKRIADDGAVYDMDNMRIVTPKRHFELHGSKK